MDLLQRQQQKEQRKNAPLADRLRPQTLEDIVGQDAVLAAGKPLRDVYTRQVFCCVCWRFGFGKMYTLPGGTRK